MPKSFASIHRKDFNNLKELSLSISNLQYLFSNYPKDISTEKEEKKIDLFVKGFKVFFQSFRLWKTLIKVEKNEYILKSAFHFLFFSKLTKN